MYMQFVTTVIQDSVSICLKINIILVESITPWKFCILQKKGSHLRTVERFCIHRETKNNHQLSDQYMIQLNTVFKAILLDSYDDHPRA